MPIAGPFYYAWVDPDETTFNSSHYRMDEYVFSAKRTIAEGEKPLLEIEIQNPHVGILSSGRKYWAWFSWFDGTSIVPLFFGRVVGTPVEIFEEAIQVQLVSWPIDYKQRVQLVAETLKYLPFYDQVFIDVGLRDDPDTILEAHAKVWDVDPVTNVVTANDIIVGADGNEDFTGDDHFYDSMQMTIGQPRGDRDLDGCQHQLDPGGARHRADWQLVFRLAEQRHHHRVAETIDATRCRLVCLQQRCL